MFLRDNKAFEEETHKILARTVSAAVQLVSMDSCYLSRMPACLRSGQQ